MKRNPSGLAMLILLGGAAGVGYYMWRRSRVATAPGPQVHDGAAADAPPSPDELAAGGCYIADRPLDEPGYRWECRNGAWKKRRTGNRVRTVPTHTTTLMAGWR